MGNVNLYRPDSGKMSRRKPNQSRQVASRWPHRLAGVLVCTAFAQILVGGSVTSYSAGMAVPDWPTTYDHWLYPPRLWLAAPRDLFLAGGHRMLGSLVILAAVAQAVVLWTLDRRKWMRWLAAGALGGVLLQEGLGGLRVLSGQILPARIHGCTAPLFFALSAALLTLTSGAWQQRGTTPKEPPAAPRLRRRALAATWAIALAATLAIYVQIILCSRFRHLPPDSGASRFALSVYLVLILGGLIVVAMVWLLIHALWQLRGEPMIAYRAVLLGALFFAQLLLGAGAWVTNYGWPKWFTRNIWAANYTIVAEGWLQVVLTTAHAALGSLTLAVGLGLALWSLRLWRAMPR